MAVIHELPGIKVTVEVNALKAQEYDDPDGAAEDKNRANARHRSFRCIESKDDAPFSVIYEVDNSAGSLRDHSALGFYLSIDGDHKDGILWEQSRNPCGSNVWRHVVSGVRIASSLHDMDALKKFKFSKVTTVDDAAKERVANDIEVFKSVGTIQVHVYSCSVRRREGRSTHRSARDREFEVAEKALKGKAVSHGTAYSDGGLIPPSSTVSVDNDPKEPIGTYSFKYRSKDALQKELIIPRSPTPEGIDALSEEEIRRLAAERLDHINGRRSPTLKRENKGPLIKREFAEFYDLTEEPAKREWKKVKIDNNREAIDLTDD
ncbi:hypothetical protein CkaCkLH20_04959 [Colletotrichum karsti]|uniref:DUF7918 domain-containing protein n=1 Tax=Colletotrichum karsti TaxID=1095194 RepID=A0A9P6I8B4_9PEZI|nr:uncharacterized protein CkaCkLH20_04959 [Colletotrichum karsti]KAF9877824.1 hypothetical protein CkaCkLH20_04959 [Colletotrichum karsti]